jgi:hypothetical protein
VQNESESENGGKLTENNEFMCPFLAGPHGPTPK